MSSSPSGPGGGPARTSLGFKPPLLEHFALGGGKAKKLELGSMINNVNAYVRERELAKTSFQKEEGSNRKIPEGSLTKAYPTTTTKKKSSLTRQDC